MTDSHDTPNEPADDPDAIHFAQVASGIYRRVEPESVWAALHYAVRHQLPADNPTIMIMFVRIAEVYAEVREFLASQKPTASDALRSALALILDPPKGIRGAEYLPEEIQSPGEMDLCWSEFLVTGNIEPIEKVVAVLDREDLSRTFINSLLVPEDSPRLEFDDAERAQLAGTGIALGCADGPWQIMSPGDIDILLWFGLKDENAACLRIIQEMDDAQRVHLATKGAAVWSLKANASQHGKIRLFCEEQSKVEDHSDSEFPAGRGRLLIDPAIS